MEKEEMIETAKKITENLFDCGVISLAEYQMLLDKLEPEIEVLTLAQCLARSEEDAKS